MRRNSGLKGWLTLGAAVVVGSLFSTQIKEFLGKIPVVGDWLKKSNTSTNA